MLIALWILNGLLAAVNLFAGGFKLARPQAALVGAGMAWADDFSTPAIKLIGVAEVLAAVGLIVPLLTGILPILTPFAAVGLVLLQLGATIVHARRGEKPVPNLVLIVVAAVSAALGFAVVLG